MMKTEASLRIRRYAETSKDPSEQPDDAVPCDSDVGIDTDGHLDSTNNKLTNGVEGLNVVTREQMAGDAGTLTKESDGTDTSRSPGGH